MFKMIFASLTLVGLVGCSSAVKNPTKSELEPDRVVSRIDDLSSRPEWLKESEPFRVADGKIYVCSCGLSEFIPYYLATRYIHVYQNPMNNRQHSIIATEPS